MQFNYSKLKPPFQGGLEGLLTPYRHHRIHPCGLSGRNKTCGDTNNNADNDGHDHVRVEI